MTHNPAALRAAGLFQFTYDDAPLIGVFLTHFSCFLKKPLVSKVCAGMHILHIFIYTLVQTFMTAKQ